MRKVELEARVLKIIKCVEKQQPHEDSFVELKREWPKDQSRTARQIGGHANWAHGEPILWVIGIDEEKGVIGAENKELSEWYDGVKAQFEAKMAPKIMMEQNIPYKNKTVVALLFETDRFPYLVKNPLHGQKNGGPVAWEVPWRENRSTETAKRADLISIFSPLIQQPIVQVLSGSLVVSQNQNPDGPESDEELSLELGIYLVPIGQESLTIPFHSCTGALVIGVEEDWIGFPRIFLEPRKIYKTRSPISDNFIDSHSVRGSSSEIIFSGPGFAELSAGRSVSSSWFRRFPKELEVYMKLLPAGADRDIHIRTVLTRETDRYWILPMICRPFQN